jgi:indolepyruvate ferredoxin oxidoreductase, alpha subunit
MTAPAVAPGTARDTLVLLGDEAVALGALHAGISAAYAYPGTPATEIEEYLLRNASRRGSPSVSWATNEKTALEQALGVSIVGRRALVSMKHVGLNVAADPFINAALVDIRGGLVVAVADDPGMHSSQNEQDSRLMADFARVICLEPADQQQAYDMTREAFDLSERFHVPVVVRLVTRLAHSRTVVNTLPPRGQNPIDKAGDTASWVLLPGNARRRWKDLLGRHMQMEGWSEGSPHNAIQAWNGPARIGVITTGIARNYLAENMPDLEGPVPHLHIGAYPIPVQKVQALAAGVTEILVLEEGYPWLERSLRGLLPQVVRVRGKLSGEIPLDGELTPDTVRAALGLPAREGAHLEGLNVPGRPPQLCAGCPHADTYAALKKALSHFERSLVTADIGCYTLGALPPYDVIESCVCMGASVGMAKGASDAGFHPTVAVIGDSTFLHSGVTPLMDAAAAGTDMTLVILDNETVGMTGAQPTVLPSRRIYDLVLALGVPREHCHLLEAHPRQVDAMAEVFRREMQHPGLSVIIASRACLEWARKQKKSRGEP